MTFDEMHSKARIGNSILQLLIKLSFSKGSSALTKMVEFIQTLVPLMVEKEKGHNALRVYNLSGQEYIIILF